MRMRILKGTWLPTLMLGLAALALACGGAESAPASAMTEAQY